MQTKLYVGLDLHSNNTYVGALDEYERRVLKGKFPNRLEVILSVLEPFKDRVVGVVVESRPGAKVGTENGRGQPRRCCEPHWVLIRELRIESYMQQETA